MIWRNFKTNPPYDWKTETDGDIESDPDCGYALYRYTNRPPEMNSGPFVTKLPSPFKDGTFECLSKHLHSQCLTDQIEILAWAPINEANKILLDSALRDVHALGLPCNIPECSFCYA